MKDLPECPFCGELPEQDSSCWCGNSSCTIFQIKFTFEKWGHRPVENLLRQALSSRKKKAAKKHVDLDVNSVAASTCSPGNVQVITSNSTEEDYEDSKLIDVRCEVPWCSSIQDKTSLELEWRLLKKLVEDTMVPQELLESPSELKPKEISESSLLNGLKIIQDPYIPVGTALILNSPNIFQNPSLCSEVKKEPSDSSK